MDLLYTPEQSKSTDSFIYCEEKQEFRGEEGDERPGDLEGKAMDSRITSGGDVEVQTAPCEYEQAAAAKQDDPESAPVVWFVPPPLWVVTRSGSIGHGILHLFRGSVKTIDLQQNEER